MRGTDDQTGPMFSYLSPDALVPPGHPLRAIRPLTDVEPSALHGPRSDNARADHSRLRCASGGYGKDIAASLDVDQATVNKWRRRFATHRMDGLLDEPRSGAPQTLDDARIEGVIVRTLQSLPPGATQWSSRSTARLGRVDHQRAADVASAQPADASKANATT